MRISLLLLLFVLAFAFSGCTASSTPTPSVIPTTHSASSSSMHPKQEEDVAPVLSGNLKRGCSELSGAGPKAGDKAVDFTLKDLQGTQFTLSQLLKDKPVVMVSGSYT